MIFDFFRADFSLSLCRCQERTRSALLETLYEELNINSQSMMGLVGDEDKLENGGGGGGGGFFESFKVRRRSLRDEARR